MGAPTSTFIATDAAGYERTMGRWSARLAEPFLDFAGTADGEAVLDVGCGTGHLAAAVQRRCRVTRLAGIDLAEPCVEAALAIRMDFASFDDYWSPYEGREGPVAVCGHAVRTRSRAAEGCGARGLPRRRG